MNPFFSILCYWPVSEWKANVRGRFFELGLIFLVCTSVYLGSGLMELSKLVLEVKLKGRPKSQSLTSFSIFSFARATCASSLLITIKRGCVFWEKESAPFCADPSPMFPLFFQLVLLCRPICTDPSPTFPLFSQLVLLCYPIGFLLPKSMSVSFQHKPPHLTTSFQYWGDQWDK